MLAFFHAVVATAFLAFATLTNAFALAPVYTYIDLGPGILNTRNLCCETFLNSRGWVAGTFYSSLFGYPRSFIYDVNFRDIGDLMEAPNLPYYYEFPKTSHTNWFSDEGDVVGASMIAVTPNQYSIYFQENAFVYIYKDSKMYNLNKTTLNLEPGVTLTSAWKINNSGSILATAEYHNIGNHVYLLTPVLVQVSQVPEPRNLWLTLAGLLVVAVIVFWRRRR